MAFPSTPLYVHADDGLIRGADFRLTNAGSINGLDTARSALPPQVGQIVVGEIKSTAGRRKTAPPGGPKRPKHGP
jgi:hypothetical protein